MLVFVLLARAYVKGGLVVSFDDNVSRWVADNLPGSIESIARVVTWIGGVIGASVVTVVAVVVLWRASRRADALFLAAAFVGINVLVPILKAVYERARPDLGTVPPAALVLVSERPRRDRGGAVRRARGPPRGARELTPAGRWVARRSRRPGARDRHEPRPAQRALRQRRRGRLCSGARMALLLPDRAGRATGRRERGERPQPLPRVPQLGSARGRPGEPTSRAAARGARSPARLGS